MFTPELINEERGEFIPCGQPQFGIIGIDKTQYCIQYCQNMLGTIAAATARAKTCRVVYDIRGQSIPDQVQAQVRQALEQVAIVEFIKLMGLQLIIKAEREKIKEKSIGIADIRM